MPWYFPWSESIKKRACRYLLQRYLGNFMKEKLTLDQLSVNLYNGTGTIQDVLVNVESINEALESANLPVEVVDGFIGEISINIPWTALVSDSTVMCIRNLELTLQPKQRADIPGPLDGMLDSMFHSMTTSMQLAKDCLGQEQTETEQVADSATPFEGLEMFALTIEAVLTRVKVSFVNTIVRLEHLPREAKTGAALEIRIDRVEYFDDMAHDHGSPVDKQSSQGKAPVYEPAAVAHKNFHLMGVTMYCDEFPECGRTTSRTSSNSPEMSPKGTDFDLDLSLSPPLSAFSGLSGLPDDSSTVIKQPGSREGSPKSSPASKLTEPIKIAVLMGRQELRIKVKQNEELRGPKLELEFSLAGLGVHLSPRQVHLLMEIIQGLCSPDLCDDSNVRQRVGVSKPMQPHDFDRIEHDLQRQMASGRLGAARLHSHESDDSFMQQSLDDSDEDRYFDLQSMGGTTSMQSSMSSVTTNRSSSTTASAMLNYGPGYAKRESPFQATIPKAALKQKPRSRKDSLHRLLDDPSAEVTNYKLKLSFFSVILLHEDPPATPSDEMDPGQTSTDKLRKMSMQFFSRAASINTAGVEDLADLRQQFTKACPFDHLGLLGKPLSISCNQKSSAVISSTTLDLSIGLAELVESVFDRRGATSSLLGFSLPIDNILPDYCKLLVFPQDGLSSQGGHQSGMFTSMSAAAPCIRLKVQHMENRAQSSRRMSASPKTEIHFELAKCCSEVDITMIDRIQSLLSPQPLAQTASSSHYLYSTSNTLTQSRQSFFSQTMDEDGANGDQRLDCRVSSPCAKLIMRFPIPDLRKGPGQDRMPWWRRSLHKEVLILELSDADLQTSYSAQPGSRVEFTCRDAHGLFQESPDQEPVSFVRISSSDSTPAHERDDGFDWPRIVFQTFPAKHSVLEEELFEDDPMTCDSLRELCALKKGEPSPFSSRKVMYEREEMVMPGDRAEMQNFQEKAINNTRLHIELSLPNVNALLPSKDFFELVYNRVNNDLLLWEPLAPAPLEVPNLSNVMNTTCNVDLGTQLLLQREQAEMLQFSQCKSGVKHDSDTDSEEESGEFYSIYYGKRVPQHQRGAETRRQSKVSVSLTIGQGKLTFCTPLKEEAQEDPWVFPFQDDEGLPVPKRHGEFQLEIEEGNLFCTVAYNGDPDLRYVCIHANRATVFHNGSVADNPEGGVVERATFAQPSGLHPTIYLSEAGVQTKLSGQVGKGGDSQDMLSLALKIATDSYKNQKTFQMALGIRGGTLQHRMTPSPLSWFTQLLDFFDVRDFPILGYTLPQVVVEMHLHLWSCAVDYRPLFLPYRALVTAETFSISSNVVAESPTSLLSEFTNPEENQSDMNSDKPSEPKKKKDKPVMIEFIVDDAALYLSDKCKATRVDMRKNYVCVLDLGLFELSLRSSDGKDQKYPKMDLRASNNIVHLRTCSDSCAALGELIVYIANYGDLAESEEEVAEHGINIRKRSESTTETELSDSPRMTQSHMEQVHDMMADAMRESLSSEQSDSSDEDSSNPREGSSVREVFFFPDENQPPPGTSSPADSPAMPKQQLVAEMADSTGDDMSDSACSDSERKSDDEFCIIDDPGLGIAPRDGEPTVRILTADPINLKDDHFNRPLDKTDQLKAPDHFPPAVYRYTLREMSLVWYMYGGQDFESSEKSKTTSVLSSASRPTGKADTAPMGKVGWQARGGPGRNIDVLMELQLNKVRMQYELYPDSAVQASRQILLIHQIEMRDRLLLSKINKFLYQYTSDSLPRQSHANMFVVKALHQRPDPTVPAMECSLKVSILPLRLNIDQDALFFLRTFFSELSGTEAVPESSPSMKPPAQPPVMTVGSGAAEQSEEEAQEMLIKFDEIAEQTEEMTLDGEEEEEEHRAQPIYFKSFVFSPDVPIRLDYHGKRVDMEQGTLAGLLVGLAQLNCSELHLKRIHHKHGLLGFGRLVVFALNEWLQDIKKNQLPSILGGVGPMYSLVQLVQGIRDLFWLPVEQYRKDGRIVRGIQRGAHSFTTSTAIAALELTNRLVQTVQYAAEVAYDMVSPGPSVRHKRHFQRQRRAAQPADIREGVTNAYQVVKEGIHGTASNLVNVAVNEHEQKGMTGAVGGVLRQIPPTVIQPVIIATEATSNVLGGMRNQLRPDRRREDEDKWKPDDD